METMLIALTAFCAVFLLAGAAFAAGLRAGAKKRNGGTAPGEPLTEQQKTELEQAKKEYRNFLSYNGKEQ